MYISVLGHVVKYAEMHFSFVNSVLLHPLPYAGPNRIVRVLEAPPGGGRNGISTLNYLDRQIRGTARWAASPC